MCVTQFFLVTHLCLVLSFGFHAAVCAARASHPVKLHLLFPKMGGTGKGKSSSSSSSSWWQVWQGGKGWRGWDWQGGDWQQDWQGWQGGSQGSGERQPQGWTSQAGKGKSGGKTPGPPESELFDAQQRRARRNEYYRNQLSFRPREGDTYERSHVCAMPWAHKHSALPSQFWREWELRAQDQDLILRVRRARRAQIRERGGLAAEFQNTLTVRCIHKYDLDARRRALDFLGDFASAVANLGIEVDDLDPDDVGSTNSDESDGAEEVEVRMYGVSTKVQRAGRHKSQWLQRVAVDVENLGVPSSGPEVERRQVLLGRQIRHIRRQKTPVRLQSVPREVYTARNQSWRQRSRERRQAAEQARREAAENTLSEINARRAQLLEQAEEARRQQEEEERRLQEARQRRMESIRNRMDEERAVALSSLSLSGPAAEDEVRAGEQAAAKQQEAIAAAQAADSVDKVSREQQQREAQQQREYEDQEAARMESEVDWDDEGENMLDMLREFALEKCQVASEYLTAEDSTVMYRA